jgi:hypothetical protein
MLYTIAEIVYETCFGEKFYNNMETFTDEVSAQHRLAELQEFNPQIILTIREQ